MHGCVCILFWLFPLGGCRPGIWIDRSLRCKYGLSPHCQAIISGQEWVIRRSYISIHVWVLFDLLTFFWHHGCLWQCFRHWSVMELFVCNDAVSNRSKSEIKVLFCKKLNGISLVLVKSRKIEVGKVWGGMSRMFWCRLLGIYAKKKFCERQVMTIALCGAEAWKWGIWSSCTKEEQTANLTGPNEIVRLATLLLK